MRNLFVVIYLLAAAVAAILAGYAFAAAKPWYFILVGGVLSGFCADRAWRLDRDAPFLHHCNRP
jgi:hypothetical protein